MNKKNVFKFMFLIGLMGSINANAQTSNYSLETESQIYTLKNKQDDKRFCRESVDAQIATDEVGKYVIQNSCRANYFSFNLINKWGDELYKTAMTKPNVTRYEYSFPFGFLPNEKLMSYSVLKDTIFWTSIDRFGQINPATKKQKQIKVTENQYKFFKNVFEDLKKNDVDKFRPVDVPKIENKFNFQQMSQSKGYINYAQGLLNSKKEAQSLENSLDVVFKSFSNYKDYLDYVYNGQIQEFSENPNSFRNHKFTQLQCVAIKIAIIGEEFDKLQKDLGFTCNK